MQKLILEEKLSHCFGDDMEASTALHKDITSALILETSEHFLDSFYPSNRGLFLSLGSESKNIRRFQGNKLGERILHKRAVDLP